MEESPKERFYLWIKSKTYGWTPIGNLTGYESVEELQRDNEFYIRTGEKRTIIVMRATPYLYKNRLNGRLISTKRT